MTLLSQNERRVWTRQPQLAVSVRPALQPIGGIQPGGFLLYGTDGQPLTVGSGVSLTGGNAQHVAFTAATTGLTKTITAVSYPLTFVFRGSTSGSGPRCLGSLATSGDKLARVYGLDGVCSAQHIGATTFSNATTGGAQWSYGTDFTCVAVFQSQTDVRIYVSGSAGSAQAQSTTDVGTLSALPKLAFGVYDGSVKTYEQNGTTELAQWLNVGMTDAQAWYVVRNPWALFKARRTRRYISLGAGGGSAITGATGTSTTASLAGRSTNAATLTGAAGASSVSALTGRATFSAALTGAVGSSSTSAVAGRSTNAAALTGAVGASTASALAGRSTNAASLTGAVGSSSTSTLTGAGGSSPSVISDISGGWTPSSGVDNYAMVDEVSYSDADYTTSPDLTTPEVFGITARAAGTWDINYRALRTGATGDVRMVLRDAGGSVVGTGAWQTMLASFASYTDTITTSGVAEQLKIEIRA